MKSLVCFALLQCASMIVAASLKNHAHNLEALDRRDDIQNNKEIPTDLEFAQKDFTSGQHENPTLVTSKALHDYASITDALRTYVAEGKFDYRQFKSWRCVHHRELLDVHETVRTIRKSEELEKHIKRAQQMLTAMLEAAYQMTRWASDGSPGAHENYRAYEQLIVDSFG